MSQHPFFQRDGADLYRRAPVSMVRAELGGEIKVHTLAGFEVALKIPEGTQSGSRSRQGQRAGRCCADAIRAICMCSTDQR